MRITHTIRPLAEFSFNGADDAKHKDITRSLTETNITNNTDINSEIYGGFRTLKMLYNQNNRSMDALMLIKLNDEYQSLADFKNEYSHDRRKIEKLDEHLNAMSQAIHHIPYIKRPAKVGKYQKIKNIKLKEDKYLQNLNYWEQSLEFVSFCLISVGISLQASDSSRDLTQDDIESTYGFQGSLVGALGILLLVASRAIDRKLDDEKHKADKIIRIWVGP